MRPSTTKFSTLLFLSRAALASPFLKIRNVINDDHHAEPGSSEFWSKVIISIGLVLAGGVFAGLTLGLMGLDELHLRVLATSSDDEKERLNAHKVLKLMGKGRHWVLVVLLLGNVIINESLPIFLDSALGGGIAAIAISTTAIVIFGNKFSTFTSSHEFPDDDLTILPIREIIPQAVSVRYGLSIGAACSPIVLAMMYLFAPIAWPTAKLLDFVLGANEEHTYKKAELKSFLQFHRTGEEPLRDVEIAILNGVLELNAKHVEEIMTPLKDTLVLSADTKLGQETVDKIMKSGYSRFPVHEPGNPLAFIGTLLVKRLINYDPNKALSVSSFSLSVLPEASPSINCFQALDYFQTGRSHLLLISKTPGVAGGGIGIITLEDIIEEMITEEIVDETDTYEDNTRRKHPRRTTTAEIMRGIVERGIRRRVDPGNQLIEHSPLLTEWPSRDASEAGTSSRPIVAAQKVYGATGGNKGEFSSGS